MPRAFCKIELLSFREKEYTKHLEKHTLRSFAKATKAFIEAAAPLIPVDTGMARGSLLNMSRALENMGLGIRAREFNTDSISEKEKKYYHPPFRGHIKNAELGQRLATPDEKVIQIKGSKVSFSFDSRVFHLTLNNFFHTPNVASSPWHAFEAGREAFKKTAKAELRKRKGIKKFLTKTTISTGRTAGIETKVTERSQETGP